MVAALNERRARDGDQRLYLDGLRRVPRNYRIKLEHDLTRHKSR